MPNNLLATVLYVLLSSTNPIFNRFYSDSLMYLANEATCERFSTEELVFKKGSIGNKYYMIVRGVCESYTSNEEEGQEVLLAKLIPLKVLNEGEGFGMSAILENILRTTTVISKARTTCLSISTSTYHKHLSVLNM